MPQHFIVGIDTEDGTAFEPMPIGANDETDIGKTPSGACFHLVLARNSFLAKVAAEKDHADESEPCPVYPTRKGAYEVLE